MSESGPARTWLRRWLPFVAFLATLPILLSLGTWQLQRAGEVEAVQAQLRAGQDAPPVRVDGSGTRPPYSQVELRRVEARGRYLADRQVLIDNQARGGTPGYRVLTPLELERGGVILVDRGWVEGDLDRRVLPDVRVDDDPRTVRGTLDRGPRTGMQLGASIEGDPQDITEWPLRMQYLDYDRLAEALDTPVGDYLIRLSEGAEDGYVLDWTPTWSGPERHYGYAFQWYALAAALCVIYIVLRRRRRTHE